MEKQVRYFRCKKAKLPSSRNADSLYYTTDTGELFLGPKQIGINVPELSILTSNNSSSSTPVIYKNNTNQTQLDVDLVNTKGLLVQTATTFLCDILPGEKDTYKLGSSNTPFAEAHVKNIKTVNTITRPASATNAIKIGLENSGKYTGAYFRLSSSPNTQIPTIGLKGNILPDTSGGASGAKYNLGSIENQFNEIYAQKIIAPNVNAYIPGLCISTDNVIANVYRIGNLYRLTLDFTYVDYTARDFSSASISIGDFVCHTFAGATARLIGTITCQGKFTQIASGDYPVTFGEGTGESPYWEVFKEFKTGAQVRGFKLSLLGGDRYPLRIKVAPTNSSYKEYVRIYADLTIIILHEKN